TSRSNAFSTLLRRSSSEPPVALATTVSQPARAVAWAMPSPIWPEPSTPTRRIAITLSFSAVGGLVLPCEPPDALDHLLERGLLSEDRRDAGCTERRTVGFGDDPSQDDRHTDAAFSQQLHEPLHDRAVGPREEREPDHVDVLLQRRLGD